MQALNSHKGWYDVKDQDGNWRLGKEVGVVSNELLQIRLEGWSSKYDSVYCIHSQNIAPPRTHSQGYTTQEPFPLREILNEQQLKQLNTSKVKLNLLLTSDLTRMNPAEINLFFRVQLFTIFDTLLTLPFQHQNIKQTLDMTKFLISIVNLAIKVLKDSSTYLPTVKSNPHHEALHKASYQIFLMLRGTVGLNNRYKKFFDHPENQFNKSLNSVEYLLNSESEVLLLFNSYFKTLSANNMNSDEDFARANEVMSILLELYEKQLISEKYSTHLKILLDTLSAYIKTISKNKPMLKYLTENSSGKYLINMFENMHLKLKPDKKFIQLKEMKEKEDKKEIKKAHQLEHQPSARSDIDDKKIQAIQQRLLKLEADAQENKSHKPQKNQQVDLLTRLFKQKQKQIKKTDFINVPVDYDFNEISFLNALQLHMANNQIQKANKLIEWRKKILQISVLAGWDVARMVAKNTQHKLEVDTQDILMSNLDYLRKSYAL